MFRLRLLCLFTEKWQPFQFLVKFVKNVFYFANIFYLRKHQVFVLINVRNIQERQSSSNKSRLRKCLLYDKRSTKNPTLLLLVIQLFQFFKKMTLKKFWKELQPLGVKLLPKIPFILETYKKYCFFLCLVYVNCRRDI